MSKIIDDLTNVPDIIAALGLSIAEAQRKMNLDYLQGIERILKLAKELLGHPDNARSEEWRVVLAGLLTALAPPRYQFTETTLSVRLDLAQSLDTSVSGSAELGFGAVALNAGFAVGFGYDYRAAAECKTTLHAIASDPNVLHALLDRARQISDTALTLPDERKVDRDIVATAKSIFDKLGERPADKPPAQAPSLPAAPAATPVQASASGSSASPDTPLAAPAKKP